MHGLARILVVAVLAAFVAGSVVHATSAAAMVASGAGDMANCDGCGPGDGNGDAGPACDFLCPVADLSPGGVLAVGPGAAPTASEFRGLVGRTGPPEPYPPRTLI